MNPKGTHPVPAEPENTETQDAIAAFEEILDVFPNDVGTLDALAQSYHLLGKPQQEAQYLKRLIHVLLEQDDRDAAAEHSGRLEPLAKEDAESAELFNQLREMGLFIPAPEPSTARPAEEPAGKAQQKKPLHDRSEITDAEMTLAWNLKEAGIFSDEEYASVVKDLTEISGQDPTLTLSVLHVLHDRSSRNSEAAFAYLVKESKSAPAPLENLEIDEETARLLPPDIMITQGIAVFDHIGKELLVATMNPLRAGLKKRLEGYLNRPCHLFAVQPTAFDNWVSRVMDLLKETSAAP